VVIKLSVTEGPRVIRVDLFMFGNLKGRKMSEPVQFDYELPGGDMLEVNATVAPGRPAIQTSLNFPGEPEEDPEIEITDCFLKDRNGNLTDLPFDPEGLWYRDRDKKFKQVMDDLENYAWETYRDQQ
jgi:hypothetical protein